MTIIRKLAAPAFAAAFTLGTAMSLAAPAYASHDRGVEHQDRGDKSGKSDRGDKGDRGNQGDRGGHGRS